MSQEVDLEKLNREYPCDKRGGYGVLKHCNCKDDDGKDKIDKTRIMCLMRDKVLLPMSCKVCLYQKQKFGGKH